MCLLAPGTPLQAVLLLPAFAAKHAEPLAHVTAPGAGVSSLQCRHSQRVAWRRRRYSLHATEDMLRYVLGQ
jgi:hypothetical protein